MGQFYKLKQNGFEIPPDCRVLKREQYSELCAATDIIAEAEKAAERIVEEAHAVYESRKKQGYEDGLLEGKMELAEQMMANVSNAVDYFASIESQVIHIVMRGVKKVIGKLPSHELITSVVRNALAAARNQKQVTIKVCPEELKVVKEKLDAIIAEYPGVTFVEIEVDPRLKPGGCILESDMGTVDASIDVQIEAMQRAVARSFKQRENE